MVREKVCRFVSFVTELMRFVFCCRDLKKKANGVNNCKAKIELLGSYDPEKQLHIQDPYYVSTTLLAHAHAHAHTRTLLAYTLTGYFI